VFWNNYKPPSTAKNLNVKIYLPVSMSLLRELFVYGHSGNHINHYKGQCTLISLFVCEISIVLTVNED